MDIVTRIKTFLNNQGFAVSQFADRCEIPRPTVSQLLNGRNKKVSDEIISKIHIAYPNLSIMWLMFGEEPMLIGGDVADDKNLYESSMPSFSLFDENTENPNIDASNNKNLNLREINSADSIDNIGLTVGKSDTKQFDITKNSHIPSDIRKIMMAPDVEKSEIKSRKSEKEIVNIMVFYSDNSFESFKPAGR